MEFQFKPGDEAFIMSRYDGEQKVKVVAQIEYPYPAYLNGPTQIQPCYELDRRIQIGKNAFVGSAKYEFHEQEHSIPEEHHQPCPQWRLYKESMNVV